MTVKRQKTARNWIGCGWVLCTLPLAGCMGSGTSFLEDTGLTEPLPAPLSAEPSSDVIDDQSNAIDDQSVQVASSSPSSTDDALYADLPTGPNDTGTYPDLRAEPNLRIVEKPGQDVKELTAQMVALAEEHKAGRISTAAYKRRLAYLRQLAKSHSDDMLAQIGEPAN